MPRGRGRRSEDSVLVGRPPRPSRTGWRRSEASPAAEVMGRSASVAWGLRRLRVSCPALPAGAHQPAEPCVQAGVPAQGTGVQREVLNQGARGAGGRAGRASASGQGHDYKPWQLLELSVRLRAGSLPPGAEPRVRGCEGLGARDTCRAQ